MQLIGMLDSPFVRRAAITLRLRGIPFEHRSLSVFRNYDEFKAINPLVKAPTLVGDDGGLLVDSSMIIDWAETVGDGPSLMPADPAERLRALRLIGLGLVAAEKTVQIIYEGKRDEARRDANWVHRVESQLMAAYTALERDAQGWTPWLLGDVLSQADVTVAVAWRFTQLIRPDLVTPEQFPTLAALSERAEGLQAFAVLPPE